MVGTYSTDTSLQANDYVPGQVAGTTEKQKAEEKKKEEEEKTRSSQTNSSSSKSARTKRLKRMIDL